MVSQVDYINVNYRASVSTQNAKDAVVFVGKCKLISLLAVNSTASIVYLQAFDASAVPTNGTTPSVASLAVPANGSAVLNLAEYGGLLCSNGLVWAESSTPLTLTLATSADCLVTAFYAILAN